MSYCAKLTGEVLLNVYIFLSYIMAAGTAGIDRNEEIRSLSPYLNGMMTIKKCDPGENGGDSPICVCVMKTTLALYLWEDVAHPAPDSDPV